MNLVAEVALKAEPQTTKVKRCFKDMEIINNDTPTGTLAGVKVGDEISNGLGTFGQVAKIDFEDDPLYWRFTFELIGGGIIEATKMRNVC